MNATEPQPASGSETATGVGVYGGPALTAYGFGHGHPFGTDRHGAFRRHFESLGLDRLTLALPAVQATRADALLFHRAAYLDRVKRLSAHGSGFLDRGDTPIFAGVWEAALTVAGSVLDAIRRITAGELKRAFIPIAGLHHARADHAAGFCVLNDCAIAIEALRHRHGMRRGAAVDREDHHGDGVVKAEEDHPECFIVDVHEDGRFLYPGTGTVTETGIGAAIGTKLNIPLPPQADDAVFREIWYAVEAFLARAEPEFVIFQCGADSLAGDPIAHLGLSPASHALAARSLCQMADTHCSGRLLALGGGGYKPDNLAAAWAAVIREMLDPPESGP